ncbi:uncharacterized protein PV06_11124 [Exophiala oligosperma]|uniref:Uncharacterized protein n=1 Tax=Exophiala oligosperma TaxID=215243 RepID=A0A0D2D2Z0_9EURO|nr:uncharacterized protein PV06_11124 [Exophiala oligosperma]KIW36610.1 hypothetical protein PV06_11124 [Exophiala oligosperma]
MDHRIGGFYPTPEPSRETENDVVFKLLDSLPNFGDSGLAPLALTSLVPSKLPVIEIQDEEWLACFQSQTTAIYRDRQLGMSVISLKEAVLVLYRLSGMDGIRIPKEHVDAALAELKRRLLYFAIDRRNKGDMREYFAVLPLVSIGELIGLKLNETTYTGHLRKWDSKEGDLWHCILRGKYEEKIYFDWKELNESQIVLTGDMRQLRQELSKKEK